MPDRKTTADNAYETTLASPVSAGAVEITVDDAGSVAANQYLVISPRLDATREVVRVTSVAGPTFQVERFLAGSAAPSGISHSAGATVASIMVGQYLEDLHDRVDADKTEHDSDITTVTGLANQGITDAATAQGAANAAQADATQALSDAAAAQGDATQALADAAAAQADADSHGSRHASSGADPIQIGDYLRIAGAQGALSDLTSGYQNVCSATIVKPAEWPAMNVVAWGSVWGRAAGATGELTIRMDFQGTGGGLSAERKDGPYQANGGHRSASVRQQVQLTSDVTVRLQAKEGTSNIDTVQGSLQLWAYRVG